VIERFNFYDVFGFLIPGSVLFLALGLPFCLSSGRLPNADLASAVAAIIAAYLAGHFLQAFASAAHPSTIDGRAPSSYLLDPDNPKLSMDLRTAVIELMKREYGRDVAGQVAGSQKATDSVRTTVFFQARERLLALKQMGYAEQHQGIYTMMRGNMVAARVGLAHAAGWAVAPSTYWGPEVLSLMTLAFVVFAMLDYLRRSNDDAESAVHAAQAQVILGLFYVLAFFAGLLFGAVQSAQFQLRVQCAAIAAGWLCVALQSRRSYRKYSEEYARALYRAFVENVGRPVTVPGRP
jgi:hypothetical protein